MIIDCGSGPMIFNFYHLYDFFPVTLILTAHSAVMGIKPVMFPP